MSYVTLFNQTVGDFDDISINLANIETATIKDLTVETETVDQSNITTLECTTATIDTATITTLTGLSNLTLDNLTINTLIIPSVTNTVNLGSITRYFNHAWIKNVDISGYITCDIANSSSLYSNTGTINTFTSTNTSIGTANITNLAVTNLTGLTNLTLTGTLNASTGTFSTLVTVPTITATTGNFTNTTINTATITTGNITNINSQSIANSVSISSPNATITILNGTTLNITGTSTLGTISNTTLGVSGTATINTLTATNASITNLTSDIITRSVLPTTSLTYNCGTIANAWANVCSQTLYARNSHMTSNGNDLFLNTGTTSQTIYIRPNGSGSTTGQTLLTPTTSSLQGGKLTIASDGTAYSYRLGINGTPSSVCQASVTGNMSINSGRLGIANDLTNYRYDGNYLTISTTTGFEAIPTYYSTMYHNCAYYYVGGVPTFRNPLQGPGSFYQMGGGSNSSSYHVFYNSSDSTSLAADSPLSMSLSLELRSDYVQVARPLVVNPNGSGSSVGQSYFATNYVSLYAGSLYIDSVGRVGVNNGSSLGYRWSVADNLRLTAQIKSSSTDGTALVISNTSTGGKNWSIGCGAFSNVTDFVIRSEDSKTNHLTIDQSGNVSVPGNFTANTCLGGSWAASASNATNVSSISISAARYTRVGFIVQFSIRGSATFTFGGVGLSPQFNLSLPIASNFTSISDAISVGWIQYKVAYCSADTTNKNFLLTFGDSPSAGSGVYNFSFTGQYQIQ